VPVVARVLAGVTERLRHPTAEERVRAYLLDGTRLPPGSVAGAAAGEHAAGRRTVVRSAVGDTADAGRTGDPHDDPPEDPLHVSHPTQLF